MCGYKDGDTFSTIPQLITEAALKNTLQIICCLFEFIAMTTVTEQ